MQYHAKLAASSGNSTVAITTALVRRTNAVVVASTAVLVVYGSTAVYDCCTAIHYMQLLYHAVPLATLSTATVTYVTVSIQ